MEIETLKAMSDGMYLDLMMLIEVIVRISVFFSMAGFAVYLAGIAWLCFEEKRQPARRRGTPAPPPPAPNEYGPLAVMEDGLDHSLARGARRCEGTLQRISID